MIKLLFLCTVQSVLSVLGAMLINITLVGTAPTPAAMLRAGLTTTGILGVFSMLMSFVVLSITLSAYKASSVIPINTALTFVVTVLLGYIMGHDRVSYTAVAGMFLIVSGIALVLRAQ